MSLSISLSLSLSPIVYNPSVPNNHRSGGDFDGSYQAVEQGSIEFGQRH